MESSKRHAGCVFTILQLLIWPGYHGPLEDQHQSMNDSGEGMQEYDGLDNDESDENLLYRYWLKNGHERSIDEISKLNGILPRLRELMLVFPPLNDILAKLLRSRWRPFSLLEKPPPSRAGSPVHSDDEVSLQKVRIQYPGRVGKRAPTRLRTLRDRLPPFREDGMDVGVLL
ncbi:hypothetical protein GGU11DRAFT_747163 [Lentinula aff. detonsa]|nr:hypothetical protein GGU11DRAFT_747163 [Lentinula aff. detonsa]